jgi:hypothetical protein
MKIYISGAITNNPNAKAQFDKAKQTLLELNKGYEPISPMDLPHEHSKSWNSFMREDIKALMDCQGIYLLAGWEKSPGANIEFNLANNLTYKVIFELDLESIEKDDLPDLEICESCEITFDTTQMKSDPEDGNWYCLTCVQEMKEN